MLFQKEHSPPEEIPTVFLDAPSSNFLCPIHGGFFVEPVVVNCGHTFCKSCLVQHHRSPSAGLCPLDSKKIQKDDFRLNLIVQENINCLQIYCKYGVAKNEKGEWVRDEKGCKEVIVLGDRAEHEKSCTFALVPCPNSKSCPLIRKMSLEEHLAGCANCPCPHHIYGCQWEGSNQNLNAHLEKCSFEPIKKYIETNQKEQIRVKEMTKTLETENNVVKNVVLQIHSKLETLVSQFEKKNSKCLIFLHTVDRIFLDPSQFLFKQIQKLWKHECNN